MLRKYTSLFNIDLNMFDLRLNNDLFYVDVTQGELNDVCKQIYNLSPPDNDDNVEQDKIESFIKHKQQYDEIVAWIVKYVDYYTRVLQVGSHLLYSVLDINNIQELCSSMPKTMLNIARFSNDAKSNNNYKFKYNHDEFTNNVSNIFDLGLIIA